MGEGERLHAQRRKRFWTILAWLFVLGAVGGFVTGFTAGFMDARGGTMSATVTAAGGLGIILFALGAAYGSWHFFANVDEVEVADNLWASLIGFYAYAIVFPTWWALWKIHLVDEPSQWAIYGAAMLIATAAYAYRKWQSR